MTEPTTIGDLVERVRLIESKQAVYRRLLEPIDYRQLGTELGLEDPSLLTNRFVAPEEAWIRVKREIEARIEALEVEKNALEALSLDGMVTPASAGLQETTMPGPNPALKCHRRTRPLTVLPQNTATPANREAA